MPIKVIKTREWDLVAFDPSRIFNAISKAVESIWEEEKDISKVITDKVTVKLNEMVDANISWDERVITVEEIQDIVEKELVKADKYELAKEYILYRSERQKERDAEKAKAKEEFTEKKLMIIKKDWTKEAFDINKIKLTFKRVSRGYELSCPFEDFWGMFEKYLIENIETRDITKMMIKSAIDLISTENTDWQYIAWRLQTLNVYKEAANNRWIEIESIYSGENFLNLMNEYIENGLYYSDFKKYYTDEEIKKAWDFLKNETDYDYNYTTMLMLSKRYLLNPNKIVKELPQEMYMAAAMFLAIPEKDEDRLKIAFEMYEYCSTQKISLPTPTLLNARTNYHQLSSCFKLNPDDDLRSIYHNIENMAQISKFGGWIGVYLWNIRSKWATIRWVHWAAGWVNPWIKVINDTAIAVNQLWARAWAISVTLDMWHKDIYDFLDLQTETWDIRRKAFDIFPAVSIPDLFMKRVEEDADFTLFDPKEVEDLTGMKLQDYFCEEFEEKYIELEKNPHLKLKETVKAKDLFKKFLKSTVETGMPYVFYRDTVNKVNPNKHAWNIYSTQLCTEICQNTSTSKFVEETLEDGTIMIKYEPGDSVVCNLASINVAKVHTDEDIEKVIPTCMRVLDNVITLNFYPIKEAEITAKKYRSVGLWFLGLAEYLACNKLPYESEQARQIVDKLFEKYAYSTLKASNDLAKERWSYELFEGSEWSKWIMIGKDEEWFKNNSQMADKWSELISNVKETGMRFAYHLAPAPNTSTASVVWTTAALLPIYKKYFVETNSVAPSVIVAPKLSADNFWYYKEYVNMNMEDVIDMISVVYKWVDQSISFEWIINPQKVSPFELYSYYMKAWKQDIKTVYYVRSMSLEVSECVSCSG